MRPHLQFFIKRKQHAINLAMLGILLLMGVIFHSQSFGQVAPVNPPSGGFNIDGFLEKQGSAGDWIPDVFNAAGIKVSPFAFHFIDAYAGGDNQFTGSGDKIDDLPSSWEWGIGNTTDKFDFNNALVFISKDQQGNTWGMFSADRRSTTGGTTINFEFLQSEIKTTPLVAGVGGFSGNRTEGDIMVAIEFSSTSEL